MNTAVAIVLDQAFDAMVIFDDDCLPPPDAIKRLLERCFDEGRPFVAGAGVMRGYPFTTTVAKYYKEGYSAVVRDEKWHLEGHQWLDDLPDALIDDVDFCGVPIAIVHRRVFERLGANCFGDQDRFGNRMTHDVYFCRKVKDAGFPVAVDGTIHCDHMVEAPIVSFDNRKVARALATGAARVQQHPCEEGVEECPNGLCHFGSGGRNGRGVHVSGHGHAAHRAVHRRGCRQQQRRLQPATQRRH